MDKPLLSICIPTYNRSKYLKNSIESIICQQEFLDGKVEIVISDNASEDDTYSVVKAYTDRYWNVFYHRNSENIRDRNFPMVLSQAHGVLRRLCNDTLVFSPDALAGMCRVIEENIHRHRRPPHTASASPSRRVHDEDTRENKQKQNIRKQKNYGSFTKSKKRRSLCGRRRLPWSDRLHCIRLGESPGNLHHIQPQHRRLYLW